MYDIAQQSFREGNSEGRHEAANFDSDNEEEIKLAVQEMAGIYHKREENKKALSLQKSIQKQRFLLECQILNKDLDEEDKSRCKCEEEDGSNEEEEDRSYAEEDDHFTDMDDVKTELLKIENANEISREQFSTDSEYVLALTHKMLEDFNVFGVSFDQLAPLVNRLVWEKQIQEKIKEEVQHILQNLPNALDNSIEPPEKKQMTPKKK